MLLFCTHSLVASAVPPAHFLLKIRPKICPFGSFSLSVNLREIIESDMKQEKKHYGLVRELLRTRVVMMEGNALSNIMHTLLKNFNGHTLSAEVEASLPERESHYMIVCERETGTVRRLQFFGEGNVLCESGADGDAAPARELEDDENRVLVLELTGPVTRNGGLCSYGSMELRDLLLEYASDKNTVGMVLVTDTPGGTCFAMHDFAQGMEAWNKAGKRSIQFIDGDSLSAGVAVGSQCQKVIAMNRHDLVGCVGAMTAGWTTADGTVDSDGNRYIYITASQTPDKNADYREASEGDPKKLQEDVDKYAAEFIKLLTSVRPQIADEQKTGKIYEAGDVIGSFVDGIGDFQMAINYARTGEEQWSTEANEQPAVDEPATEEAPEDEPAPTAVPDEPEQSTEDEPAVEDPAPVDNPDEAPEDAPEGNPEDEPGDGEDAPDDDEQPEDAPAEQASSQPAAIMEAMLARLEALDQRVREQADNAASRLAELERATARINELEQESASLRQHNQELQNNLSQSREELTTLQASAPAPAMPAPAKPKESTAQVAPVRINDSMTATEKLAAWRNREKQLNAMRRG